jgi:adenosylhomocysteine nucleosidase
METVTIITALPAEARSLTSQKLKIGQTVTLAPHLNLHVSGVGANRGRAAALHAIGQGAKALVSWGTAGGLDTHLPPGRLVLPDRLIDPQQRIFPVDSAWRNQLHASLAPVMSVSRGTLLQVKEIVTGTAAKHQLFTQSRAVAIDMESAAIAAVALQEGARFIAVRSVVDTSDCAIPPWLSTSLNTLGEVRHAALLRRLCYQPSRIFALVQLARAFSVAKSALRIAANFVCHSPPPKNQIVQPEFTNLMVS